MDIMSRYHISKILPDDLVDLVEAFPPKDRNQASPTAQLMHELVFVWGDDGLEVSPCDGGYFIVAASEMRMDPMCVGAFTTNMLQFPGEGGGRLRN